MSQSHLLVPTSVCLCAGERPFKCESCNYLAANQHEVTRHARQVHNGPKPLSCPYCDYKTADRSNYKKHVELHLNPRQFLCPLCKYAASKKCNLQYHIKSRHAGCDVAMDISKVKLRVKKAGANGAEEAAREAKLSSTSNTQEDFDVARDSGLKGVDANPINLSIRRSSRPGTSQPLQSDAAEKLQEKSCSPSDREKSARVKEQEKRVTTRQKVKRAPLKGPEEETHPGSTTAGKSPDGKAKTKVKKTTGESPSEGQAPRSDDRRTARPDKDNLSTKKKKALQKARRADSQQPDKASKAADHSQQQAGHLQQPLEKKAPKEKAPKRRAAQVLDLTWSDPPAKTRRTKGADKLQTIPEDAGRTAHIRPTATTKKKSKGTTVKEDKLSVHSPSSTVPGGPAQPQASAEISSRAEEAPPAPSGVEEDREAGDGPPDPAGPGKPGQEPVHPVENPSSPAAPEPPADAHKMEDSSPALPVEQSKPSDPEDDEGIHSSHEGASDISDSASEGSEDSGLNSNGTGSGKLPNDPETPTEELPTPTQLRSHMCIFCDRCFPLEAEYRRHLHRHLLNVYYMDNTGAQC